MIPRRCFTVEQQRGEPLARCLTTRLGPLESRRLKLPGGRGRQSTAPGAGARGALPQVVYRARPALACIIGARRACTVEMISSEALQVGAGRRQVHVAELALDQRQRNPLVQQLHSVRMAQLMGGHPPAHPGVDRGAMQLEAGGAGRPGVAARGADENDGLRWPRRDGGNSSQRRNRWKTGC
jgi:hypothetical protein